MLDHDPTPYHALAIAVVTSAVEDLKAHHTPKDVAFFLNPKLSELWLVAAGLDYDATISRLRADGHLTVTAPPKKAPRPRPIRETPYQIEMRRKVLAKLPLYPETACTARRVAGAVGVYVSVIRDALNALKATGKADYRMAPIRGGTTAMWWKVSQE